MRHNRNFLAASISALALAGTSVSPATADEKYSFPSVSGASISAAPHFVPPDGSAAFSASVSGLGVKGVAKMDKVPIPLVAPTYGHFAALAPSGDAYGYRFLTHALRSQSFANYAADYYRLFAPAYAVTAWTDRVSGIVETGYGGAVDSWTAGAYGLARVRGPSRRRNSAPDLSIMPEFRPHPELENNPTFEN
jgi:hypothetical protein